MNVKLEEQELYSTINAALGFTTDNNKETLLKFKEGGILQELQDSTGSATYASFIPKDAIEEYNVEPGTEIGLRIGHLSGVLANKSNTVNLQLNLGSGTHTVQLAKGGTRYTTPLVTTDSVNNIPDTVPNLDLPVKIWGPGSWFLDPINEIESYVYDGQSNSFWIAAKGSNVYMYANKDGKDLAHKVDLDSDVDKYETNWEDTTPQTQGSFDISNPAERERIDSLFSIAMLNLIDLYGDSTRVELGHGMPVKVVSEMDSGTKMSWVVAPRFPKPDDRGKLPDDVIEDPTI